MFICIYNEIKVYILIYFLTIDSGLFILLIYQTSLYLSVMSVFHYYPIEEDLFKIIYEDTFFNVMFSMLFKYCLLIFFYSSVKL